MNNKMTIVALVGIMTLTLLAMKPLTNQVFAQPRCPSDLIIDPHIGVQTVPKGQTTPVDISGRLTCGGVGIGGATVFYSSVVNCGFAFGGRPTTSADGSFSTTVNLGPCDTPYNVDANYAGDATHTPSTAGAGFFINEATGTATQSSNNTK